MDRGDLVPDEVIVGVIAERIDSAEAADGFILDGFPRTDAARPRRSTRELDELGRGLTGVLLIDVDDEEVVRAARRPAHLRQERPRLPRRVQPAREGGRLRRRRQRARHPRRRQARGDPPPARALPREDRAAGRLLRPAQSLLRRIDGAAAPDEVDDEIRAHAGDAAARSRRGDLALAAASVYRMIIRKTPEQVDEMAAAGRDPGPLPEDARGQGPRRGHDQGARRGRRELHPLAGRRARVQGLPRLPGLDLRLAELDGRPRDPGPLRAPARRRPLDRRRRHQRTAGSPTRRSPSRSARRSPRGAQLLETTKASLLRRRPSRCGPATSSATSPRAIQRPVEDDGLSIIRTLVGHGIGRAMHEDPQIPNFGEPGQGPAARGGHGARDRADGQRRRPRRSGWATTAGPSTPRTTRSRRTSSSRSRSPPTARGSSRPGTRPEPCRARRGQATWSGGRRVRGAGCSGSAHDEALEAAFAGRARRAAAIQVSPPQGKLLRDPRRVDRGGDGARVRHARRLQPALGRRRELRTAG